MAATAKPKTQTGRAKRWPGRPSKPTPEVEACILQVVSASGTYKDAAEMAGVGERTLAEWRRRGEEAEQKEAEGKPLTPADEEFRQFLHTLTRARASGKVGALACFTGAARTDWRAAEAHLRRLYPDEFGGRQDDPRLSERVETGPAVDLRKLTDEELLAYRKPTAKATPNVE